MNENKQALLVEPEKKKRGRKKVKEEPPIEKRFVFGLNYKNSPREHAVLCKLIKEANEKEFGREIIIKDLVDKALSKLTSKDIESIQESTLTDEQRFKRDHLLYVKKSGDKISFWQFMAKHHKPTK